MMPSLVRILASLLHGAATDSCLALVLLYLANWTHRDISAGNILVVEIDGHTRGKLSDLEYAKHFTDATYSADPKTVCFLSMSRLNLMSLPGNAVFYASGSPQGEDIS